MSEPSAAKTSYRDLLPERNYLKNVIAGTISRFGDSIDSIAYPWMTYDITGSAALSAVVFGTNLLVSVVLQPFTGALITNWNKKPILVYADAARGLLAALVALLFAFALLQPWMIIAGTALTSTLEAFRQPAAMAVYPQIVPREKYTLATSFSGMVQRIAEIVGLAIAGTIIAVWGVNGALLVDALTFFASASILTALRLPKPEKAAVASPFKAFLDDTKDGFAYVAKHKVILAISISACALNATFVPLSALQAAYISEGLKLDAQALSASSLGMTAGMVLGSFLFPKFSAKFKRFSIFFISILACTATYLGLAGIAFLPVDAAKWIGLVLVMLVMGFSTAAANNCVSVAFMENVEEAYLARASGILGSMCLAAMPVCSFIIAGIAKVVPVVTLIMGFGVVAVALSFAFLLVKPLKRM